MKTDSLKVLLIEDVPIYVGMLERVLKSSAFTVESVGTLEEGIFAAHSGDFDIVLLDLGLPDSFGIKTFTKFIQQQPNLPVVILTGTDDEDLAAEAVQKGAQDYLIKGPYLMQVEVGKNLLFRSLKYAFERQQIQAALVKERDSLESRVIERTSKLNQINQQLSALIDAMPDLLCRLNQEGVVLDIKVPETFSRFFPNPNQIIGKHFSDSLKNLFTNQDLAGYLNLIQDEQVNIIEHEVILDGENYHFEIRIVDSHELEVLILLRDVTDSKALERMWRRYEFIANTSKDLLVLIDNEYRFQAVNDAYCKGNSFERDKILGKTMPELWGARIFEDEIKPHIDLGFSGESHTISGILSYSALKGQFFEHSYYPYFNQNNKVTNIVVVSRDRTAYHQNEEMLRRYNQRLQDLATQLVSAQEEERRRISLELHDEAGQALTALKLKLALTQKRLAPDSGETEQQLMESISLVETTMEQVRRLAHNLRPPALDAVGINQAMKDYCIRFSEQSEIIVKYLGVDLPDLPGFIQINLYRMLQEALTNVIKHANAKNIEVNFSTKDGIVVLLIADDGVGLKSKDKYLRKGIGLTGIEERMEALGGSLEIQSDTGEGTKLIGYIPWKEEK